MYRDRIIALQALTGGIGRATLKLQLARALREYHRRVCMIATDGPARRRSLRDVELPLQDEPGTAVAHRPEDRPLASYLRTPEPSTDSLVLLKAHWDHRALLAAFPWLIKGLDEVALLDLVGGGRQAVAARLAGRAVLLTDGLTHGAHGVADAPVPYTLLANPGAAAALAARHNLPLAPATPVDEHHLPARLSNARQGRIGRRRRSALPTWPPTLMRGSRHRRVRMASTRGSDLRGIPVPRRQEARGSR